MSSEPQHFYDFETFRLDPDEGVLLCDGKPVPLTPKAFQMLRILIENRGHIVEKGKLMDEIWADSFVEEGSLSVNARRLRVALDDDANQPKFIETIPRRGYRFIADVEENFGIEEERSVTQSAVSAAAGLRLVASPQFYVPCLILCAFLAAGLIYYFGFSPTSTHHRRSVAVLPAQPINPSTRDELYDLGIAESLVHQLGSMEGFVIRPLSSTRAYSDLTQDPVAAGREQKVDYVLAANYQFFEDRIRVTAQLYNVGSGEIEETFKSELDRRDVFAVQDAVASDIATRLMTRFTTMSASPIARRGTSNEEAYRLYLQGMYLSNSRTAHDSQKAVETLERAVELDPNYALAWAGKAYAHRAVGNFRRFTNTHEQYQRSIDAINRALALNPNLSQAYSALCENKMYYEYDFEGAEAACEKAIELDPNSPLAHQVYSRFLPGRKRFEEAIVEIKVAIDLEPASIFHQLMLGNILQYARRYDEAAEQFKRVLAMDKNNGNAHLRLIQTLAFQKKETEAFEWFMNYLRSQGADQDTVSRYTKAFQNEGWNGVLRERARRFEEGDESYFAGAAYCAQIGDKDKAFEYLERSFERRELWMSYLHVEPLVDPLRDDPRFQDLLARVERSAKDQTSP